MRFRYLIVLGLCAAALVAVFLLRAERKEVTLFFTDLVMLEQSDCSAVIPATRSMRAATVTPDGVVRELLKGPTLEERQEKGMASMYLAFPGRADVLPILTYYRGISVKDGIATVDFSAEALVYLNAAACIQAAVKAPIEWSLLEFPEITRVEYSIDGEVFTEWDA
jgi:spore germination protein GerM